MAHELPTICSWVSNSLFISIFRTHTIRTNQRDLPSITKIHISGNAQYNQQGPWKIEMADLELCLLWWTPYTRYFIKLCKYYWEWSCNLAYSGKASFIQSQHTFAYPDKYVEVTHKPNKKPPEFHRTKKKRGVYIVIHGMMYTWQKIILYKLVMPTINVIGLEYINNSRCVKKFTMTPNKSIQTTRALYATCNLK